jgi:hypothetical protein
LEEENKVTVRPSSNENFEGNIIVGADGAQQCGPSTDGRAVERRKQVAEE